MQNLDSTIIATALPTIAADIGETPLRLNVAITCYLLSLAVFVPISGWTADRFGARRVFTAAIVVFTTGLDRLRLRQFAVDAGRRAHRAGHRRRDDGAGRPADPAEELPENRSRAGDVLCQRAGADRPDHGAAARRAYRDLRLVALDLLHQHSDRRARGAARQPVHRQSARDDGAAVRPARLRADRGRAGQRDVRASRRSGAASCRSPSHWGCWRSGRRAWCSMSGMRGGSIIRSSISR